MAKVIKVKGDATDVQTEFNHAPVGLYTGKAAEVTETKSSKTDKPMVEIRWEVVGNGDGKKIKEDYASVFYYAPLDLTDDDIAPGWARRLKEVLTAFGLPMKGANLGKIEGKNALIRLREDTDQEGEYRPRIGKILPLAGADEDDEDEDDEGDEEDYSEMSLADLKELVEERELEFTGKATKAKLVKLLEEADEEDEDEDEDEEDEDEVDLDSMTRAELKAYIKEEDLDVKILRKDDEDILREKIREAQGEDEDEEEDDDDEDDEDNYDDLSVAELREELEARSLNVKGTKKALIARLRADDEDEPV
jgi:hypothetical protein